MLARTGGWASITMAKLADRVGVSRQTVYNEIGTKSELAEAVVMAELEVFLAQVENAFQTRPDDIVEAIREAARSVLATARSNPLLHAVLSASHGAESDLLPLLTTQSEPIIDAARVIIGQHLACYELDVPEERLSSLVDMVIRLVLSHVTLPGPASPEQTAEEIAWIAARVLRS